MNNVSSQTCDMRRTYKCTIRKTRSIYTIGDTDAGLESRCLPRGLSSRRSLRRKTKQPCLYGDALDVSRSVDFFYFFSFQSKMNNSISFPQPDNPCILGIACKFAVFTVFSSNSITYYYYYQTYVVHESAARNRTLVNQNHMFYMHQIYTICFYSNYIFIRFKKQMVSNRRYFKKKLKNKKIFSFKIPVKSAITIKYLSFIKCIFFFANKTAFYILNYRVVI